jgi:O-antigen ligase
MLAAMSTGGIIGLAVLLVVLVVLFFVVLQKARRSAR